MLRVSTPLVHISEQLFAALAGNPVGSIESVTQAKLITPNERLAREFQSAFAQFASTLGNSWRKPEILSFRQWQIESYLRLCEVKPHLPKLLSANELIARAHRVLPNQLPAAMVRNMLTNWQVVTQYQIPLDECQGHELFCHWAKSLNEQLGSAGEISTSQISGLLRAEGVTPHGRLVFTEMEEITKAESSYLQLLCEQGSLAKYQSSEVLPVTTVADISHTAGKAKPVKKHGVLAAASMNQEWQAAARWAASVKMKDPTATIGIVVPELDQHYHHCALEVGTVLDPANGSRSATFDITGGTPLVDQPVWQHAVALLSGLLAPTSHDEILKLCHSPFVHLDPELQRAITHSGQLISLADMVSKVATLQAQKLSELVASINTISSLSSAIKWFLDVLQVVEWPNLGNVESHQYQAWQRTLAIFRQLALQSSNGISPNEIAGKETLEASLAIVRHALADTVFAPQRPATDIQVLGVLETTGLKFSHLWVCHVDANRFPGQHRRLSYIPNKVAQSHGVPRTSAQAEMEFARRLFSRWVGTSEEIRFSFTANIDDAPQQVSPLLSVSKSQIAVTKPRWQRQKTNLEAWHDDHGPVLQGQPKSTGVRLLETYTRCPFQSFARFRLGIDQARQPPLLADHLDRGNLAHRILQLLLEHGPSQNQIATITSAEIESAIERAFTELDREFPQRFLEFEKDRLLNLIEDWLQVETARQPFKVLQTEQRYQLDLDAFDLNIRIDRLDEVDGETLVIDYKTGRTSLQGVLADNLSNVQLPVYALLDDRIAGVAYAELGTGRLQGIGNGSCQDIQSIDDWHETKADWRAQVNNIANEFVSGRAEVAPASAEACRYCDLQSFCRISEA